jgi:hypothetical protein
MESLLVNVRKESNGDEIGNLAKALLPKALGIYARLRDRRDKDIRATCSKLMGEGNNYLCEISVGPSIDDGISKLVVEIEGKHGETSDPRELELKVSGKK